MLEKICFSLWGVMFLIIAVFFVAGLLNPTNVLILGLMAFGLIFMGMIGVLPFWTSHHKEIRH